MSRKLFLFFAVFLFVCSSIHSIDLSISSLEIDSRGNGDENGTFSIISRVFCDFLVKGDGKFEVEMKIGIDNYNAEEGFLIGQRYADDYSGTWMQVGDNRTDLHLKSISAAISQLFGLPLSMSWFVGNGATIGTGDDFVKYFKVKSFSSDYRGPSAFPEGIGGNKLFWYDGIFGINGTGFNIEYLIGPAVFSGWFYQDMYLGTGIYSADIRSLVNLGGFSFEIHGGISSPVSGSVIYRTSLLLHILAGNNGSILLQAGFPYIDPKASELFSANRVYFLFETGLNLDPVFFALTFFKRPGWYMQTPTGEGGIVDFRIDMHIGDLQKNGITGGIESALSFDSEATADPFTQKIIPYFGFLTDGISWNIALGLNILPFPGFSSMIFEPSITAKTSF